jgi:serine/threonine protein kinase
MTERFTLLEKIGRGGMGVVWRARDEETGQIVALKLLHFAYSDDPDYVTRFERELELARRIKSANVVGVLGFGVLDGTPYLALEYVDGPTLRQSLVKHGPYTWDETKALLAQIAQGLADAHAAGVVHRDIKPSNILIGSDGVAKIADFGIARGLDLTRVTGTSTLLGTPAYLPPEGPQDERSDLYSLGIVAYELLAGVPPFEGSTYAEVLMAHVRLAPDLDKLPADARPIVGWLLDKEPKGRPQSATELIATLQGKRKAPALVPAATGISAGAEPATRPVRTDAEPRGDRPDRAGRGRRSRVALLLSLFVVLLAAGAAWGAQGGFGQGLQPTLSPPNAAGAAQQPSDSASGASLPATPPGLISTESLGGSPPTTVQAGASTPGYADPTPTAIVAPSPKPVVPVQAPPSTPPQAPPSTPPQAPPTAPSNLTVTAISSSAIRLNWTDNSNNEDGFELDNGTSDLGSVPANTTTWTMTGLSSGKYMCFHLYAFNAAGNSAWTTPYACTTTP